jgi:hypothetical protein
MTEAVLTKVEEVSDFAENTDTLNDSPLSFGTPDSSGVDGRRFAPRRVRPAPRPRQGAQVQPCRRFNFNVKLTP